MPVRAVGEPLGNSLSNSPSSDQRTTQQFLSMIGPFIKGTGTRNMKKLVFAAMMFALFPVSAYAQRDKGPPTARTEKEMKDDKEIDRAYRETMKRTGSNGQAAKSDPWQTIRPPGTDSTKALK
jgi:hypothetical protein